MHRFRSRLIVAALTVTLAAPLVGPASPASAALPPGTGCKASTAPGAEIGMYPAASAAQSALSVACVFNNHDTEPGAPNAIPPQTQVSARFTVHDFPNAQWHNGAARSATVASAATNTITLTAGGGFGLSTWVNRPISGTGIPARTFVTSVAGDVLTLNQNQTGASGTVRIDNTIGRSSSTVTLSNATETISTGAIGTPGAFNFTAADVAGGGLMVSGELIKPNCFITSVGVGGTTATLNAGVGDCVEADDVAQTITLGGTLINTTTRQTNETTFGAGTATNGTLTTAGTQGNRFTVDDIGLEVRGSANTGSAPARPGPGFVAACVHPIIVSITATVATVEGRTAAGAACDPIDATSAAAATGVIVIGDPSVTAPNSGPTLAVGTDTPANLDVMLDLNPGLVAGQRTCADEDPEGFETVARWQNPGFFLGGGATNTAPGAGVVGGGTKVIGQLYFDTSVADFSGYIVERRGSTPTADEPQALVHYDVVFPFLPVTLALCPSTPTSPGVGFALHTHAQTLSVASVSQGVGKPGSAQLRSTQFDSDGVYSTTAYVRSDDTDTDGAGTADADVFWSGSEFERLCFYNDGLGGPPDPPVNFKCGNG